MVKFYIVHTLTKPHDIVQKYTIIIFTWPLFFIPIIMTSIALTPYCLCVYNFTIMYLFNRGRNGCAWTYIYKVDLVLLVVGKLKFIYSFYSKFIVPALNSWFYTIKHIIWIFVVVIGNRWPKGYYTRSCVVQCGWIGLSALWDEGNNIPHQVCF